ncbi:hypothetical protein ISCGN_008975 [Ixodes scapularis]
MLRAGVIEETKRGPYLSPIQVVPKSKTLSRFIFDCSHLTPHFPAPTFCLPPLPKVLTQCPLPKAPFFTKMDLKDAFYHFSLHPRTRPLTCFRLDNKYYRYRVLPFGIRIAPFVMQHLATAITREARARGLWCWSHIDNFLFAHSDADFLRLKTDQFVEDLLDCGFRLNPDDSQFAPVKRIRFLGFLLDGQAGTIGHTPGRYKDLLGTLQTLKAPLPISTYQRLAGLWNFYFSVYQGHFHVLRPLHQAAATGFPPPLDWVQIFSFTLAMLPAAVPFVPPTVQHAVFSDASLTGLGVCAAKGNIAVISSTPRGIYRRELFAVGFSV